MRARRPWHMFVVVSVVALAAELPTRASSMYSRSQPELARYANRSIGLFNPGSFRRCVVAGLLTCLGPMAMGCAHPAKWVDADQVAAKYGALEPRWTDASHEIGSLLYVGQVADPATTAGVLAPQPGAVMTFPGLEWLIAPGLSVIEVYISPGISIDTEHVFGPQRGSPVGTYEFVLRTEGDADCDAYERVMARAEQLLSRNGVRFERPVPRGSCLTFRFKSALDLDSAAYHYVRFFDAEFEAAGYGVMVEELRDRTSRTVARNVTCFQNYLVRQIATCPGNTSILDVFKRD